MLLRGVKMPQPLLDSTEISIIKSKARTSGRSYGGVPLNHQNGGQNGGYGRGSGRISYAVDNNHGRQNDSFNRSNPFAAHLDPNFRPPPVVGNHAASAGGYNQYQAPRQQAGPDQSYRDSHRPQSYGAPPPPPQPYNDRYSNSYNGGGYQQGPNGARRDSYEQRGGSRSFSDGYSRGQGQIGQGGYNDGGHQGSQGGYNSGSYQGSRGGHGGGYRR